MISLMHELEIWVRKAIRCTFQYSRFWRGDETGRATNRGMCCGFGGVGLVGLVGASNFSVEAVNPRVARMGRATFLLTRSTQCCSHSFNNSLSSPSTNPHATEPMDSSNATLTIDAPFGYTKAGKIRKRPVPSNEGVCPVKECKKSFRHRPDPKSASSLLFPG